ncbi:hypothetical protein CDD80_5136 [Ophiocordyceps camponoti-rufipedis]|uniref:Uncharacterized protein n=1 Tax=Ophiocordyceps camponoti-rufipedis TaxID=2004952 RepID=A0A2C5YVB4_9HYPO|nr:hypothetical protein CDD80_5136 [Ophiocordyceps camponoti-rufipedis]
MRRKRCDVSRRVARGISWGLPHLCAFKLELKSIIVKTVVVLRQAERGVYNPLTLHLTSPVKSRKPPKSTTSTQRKTTNFDLNRRADSPPDPTLPSEPFPRFAPGVCSAANGFEEPPIPDKGPSSGSAVTNCCCRRAAKALAALPVASSQ